MRRRLLVVHRINGYTVLLLTLVSTAGALMLARRAFGGGFDVQAGVATISLMFVASLAVAYYSIKRLRVEQHRRWMLRAWFYAGSIITTRIIQGIAALIISSAGGHRYYSAQPCDKIAYMLNNDEQAVLSRFPGCTAFLDGSSPDQHVVVAASTRGGSSVEAAAMLNTFFGAALWLALAIHAIGIEIYVSFPLSIFSLLLLLLSATRG